MPELIAGVAEVQQAFANSLSAKRMNSKTCAQKGDYTYYGMYAKRCEREPCGDVWQEVGDIQGRESHLPPLGARLCCRPEDVTACCAFGLSDASLRRSRLREEYGTGVANDRRTGSSDGNFALEVLRL